MLKEFLRSKAGALWLGMLATLLCFIILWCGATTFRALSDWMLYPVNLLMSVLLILPYMLFRRVWVQVVTMAALQALLIANLMYCRTFFSAIPLDSYGLASNLADFTSSITDSLRAADLLFPLITVATAIIARRRPRPASFRRAWTVTGCAAALFAVITAGGLAAKGGFIKEADRISQSCYYSTTLTPVYTLAGSLLHQALTSPTTLTPELEAEVSGWLAGKETQAPYQALPDSVERRSSLVLILCESLESWVLQTELDGHPVTPVLDSLIALPSTLYAPNVVTQVGAGRSIDAQLLINAGLLPMLHSVYSMKYPSRRYPSLNKAMREQYGARSMLLSVDKPITWNQAGVSRSFGCDTLLDRSAWQIDEVIGSPAKLSDRSFLRQCAAKLSQADLWPAGASRYVTIITYSGHNPFILPDRLKDPAFAPSTAPYPERLADYLNMAHYTDSALSEIISYLSSRPDYKDMLVVITGDHEGLASYRSEFLAHPEGRKIVSPGQFTPLIILNSPLPGRHDAVMGQIDIYPTLLNLMGLDSYQWKGLGNSIFSPAAPSFAIVSMTGETVGDTLATPPVLRSLTRRARSVSDAMITFDLFP